MIFQFGEVFSKGKMVDLVLFFDPNEARDRELILVVHSLSNRSMKRLALLITFSSLAPSRPSQCRTLDDLSTALDTVPKLKGQRRNPDLQSGFLVESTQLFNRFNQIVQH